MRAMKPVPTDNTTLPHRYRNLVPLTGLAIGQVHTVCALTRHRLPPRPGRPWALPFPVRVRLVLVHLRTNLTTRALAALFHTSQSAVDRIIHRLVPALARALPTRPRQQQPPVDHRRRADPGARPIDHRHQQELPPQRQHPNHHLRPPAPRARRRAVLAR
ncbi:MAG: helix-turn-helix domain-containing protein [Mycobacterium sp.]